LSNVCYVILVLQGLKRTDSSDGEGAVPLAKSPGDSAVDIGSSEVFWTAYVACDVFVE
jgi:hypothetical protein